MKLDWDFRIPTEGMIELTRESGVYPMGALNDDRARLTLFYEDRGQLSWAHGRGCQTVTGYFIQSIDGEMFFVAERSAAGEDVLPFLDANIKSEVIRCRVPMTLDTLYENKEMGVLLFLGDYHPSILKRVDALGTFLKRYPPELTEQQRAELRARWIKQGQKLGIKLCESEYPQPR